MTKKYKLTNETKEWCGITLHRIEYLKDFAGIEKGEKGGWLEKEENLSQDGNAQVYGNAQVSGNAQVYDDAQVYGDAWVSGNAQVYDDAQVYGDAQVFGDAWVSGDTWVYGNAWVSEKRIIGGYFYHHKEKLEVIEKIDCGDGYELLCSEPVFGEDEKETLIGKRVEVTVDGKKYKAVIEEA